MSDVYRGSRIKSGTAAAKKVAVWGDELISRLTIALMIAIYPTTCAWAQTVERPSVADLPPQNVAPQPPASNGAPAFSFDEVAAHCFKIADERSNWAAAQVLDYDGDSIGGAIGSGLALSIERKKLRKKIYVRCMDVNGFPNTKFAKPKTKS